MSGEMSKPEVVANLEAARKARHAGSAGSPFPSGAAKAFKSDPPPPNDASHDDIAQWLTRNLGLLADPIARVERYGPSVEARVVLVLTSGRRVTFERQADLFEPVKLAQTVMVATTAQVPYYGRPDAFQVAGAVLRLSDLLLEADDREEATEWGASFLEAAKPNAITVEDYCSAAGRYAALSALLAWKPSAEIHPLTPPAERSALLVDFDTNTTYLRTSDFAAHVRGLTGRPISWAALHARMVEVEWRHLGRVEQRQPGGPGKIKARLYAVPAGWDDDE